MEPMARLLKIFFRAEGTKPWLVLGCLILSGMLAMVGWTSVLPLLSLTMGEIDDDQSAATSAVRAFLAEFGLPLEVNSVLLLIAAGFTLRGTLVILAMRYVGYTAADVATGVRERLIRGLLDARWDYFTGLPAGRVANAVSTEATRAGQTYLKAGMFVQYSIEAMAYVAVIVLYSWQAATAALVLGLCVAVGMTPFIRRSRKAGTRQTDHTARLVTYLNDALGNVKPLKAMERQSHFGQHLGEKIKKLRKALRKEVISYHVMRNLQEILIGWVLCGSFFVAKSLFDVPTSQLVAVGALTIRTMLQIASTQQQFQKGVVLEAPYLSLHQLIAEVENAREPSSGSHPAVLDDAVRFEGVTFSHGSTPVLKDASLALGVGTVTVVSGPSGGGKTTLTDLVLGLHRADAGAVTVDGVSLADVEMASWRRQIGYVPQEPVLLHDSVRANVTLGNDDIDDARIWAALEASGARAFVEPLEEQLDTSVGERGTRFSGGQRQRIALARALVREPRLLILDEMTSGLDHDTELDICNKVAALASEMAVLVITHRDTWDAFAHQRYVLDAGKLERVEGARRA